MSHTHNQSMVYLLRPDAGAEFYKCFLLSSLGWFVMEFGDLGFGFLFLGSFSQTLNALWMLLMLAFGVKILKFRSKRHVFIQSESKTRTAIGVQKPELGITEENENEEEAKENMNEKDEADVKTLRKMVKSERRRRKKAVAELEKERMAAATAAEEAMAMILRLQREKSVIEIQANQDRLMAEQRQEYYHQVIRYLERIATEYEQKSWRRTAEMGREDDEPGEDDAEITLS